MTEYTNKVGMKMVRHQTADPETINSLMATLNSDDGLARQQARITLIHIGTPAVEPLIKALASDNQYMHWEAAKALSQIGDPQAVDALVNALEDEKFSIRWLAAEGLIATGRSSVVPLLRALIERSGSVRLREGAHHVLHDLVTRRMLTEPTVRAQISSVLAALRGVEPALETPLAAYNALQTLRQSQNTQSKD
jgi:HEAT repeat protein